MENDTTIKLSEEKENMAIKSKKKKPFYLPHWFLYIAWSLCILTILGCSFLLVSYGMSFGNNKSLQWLSSITFSLLQDILLIQPIKVSQKISMAAVINKKVSLKLT